MAANFGCQLFEQQSHDDRFNDKGHSSRTIYLCTANISIQPKRNWKNEYPTKSARLLLVYISNLFQGRYPFNSILPVLPT
jgi:hypothetical protein